MREPTCIDTIEDPRIDAFRDVRDRDLRGRDGLFMAESELVLRRLLRKPERVEALLLSPGKLARLRPELAPLPDRVPVYVAELDLIGAIAGFHVHRGVLAAGRRPASSDLSLDAALGHLRAAPSLRLLLAEGITNVDNMGALFRNAATFGIDGIVLDPACCDPLYRKSIRVSMGHALSVPWAVAADWPGDLSRLREEWGVTLVGAEAQAGARAPWALPRTPRMAVLVGSEGEGLSRAALERCDLVCEIPMREPGMSLNVAVASAVLLYELGRDEA